MLDASSPFREREYQGGRDPAGDLSFPRSTVSGQLTIDHDLILPEDVDGLGFGEWMLELAKCGTQASGS